MATFSVAARTLIHLGAELITSDEVAINELVKNSFDAESPRVRIEFHIALPQLLVDQEAENLRKAKLGPPLKRQIAAAHKTLTEAVEALGEGTERTSLLKRLAPLAITQGRRRALAIVESMNRISIMDTGSGMSAQQLESVFLRIGTTSRVASQRTGKLKRRILGNKGIGRLAMMRLGARARVTSWIDPEKANIVSFNWRDFEADNKELSDIPIEVKSSEKTQASPSGTIITISALRTSWTESLVQDRVIDKFLRRLQDPFARPAANRVPSGFPIDVHVNGGKRIPIPPMKAELTKHAQADFELAFNPSGVPEAKNKAVVLTTAITDHRTSGDVVCSHRSIDELATKLQAIPTDFDRIGPFRAHIRWFNRDQLRRETQLQGYWKAAKDELDLWSGGIAIYRDGFRVGFTGQSDAEDWLALDSRALRQSGFTLNRIQVVGALYISRSENPKLIDRSNREGLINSPESALVREILSEFGVGELRRYIDHEGRQAKTEELAELVERAPASIRERALKAEQGLMDIRNKVGADVRPTIQSIADHLHFIRSEVKNFEEAAKRSLGGREDILELAGVGTVMSGVMHELTRTTAHTRELIQKISTTESPETRSLLEKLDAEIKAINTRLRQLDPLTPSGRHRKELFDIAALLRTVIQGYEARLERHGITCVLEVTGADANAPVMVKMVRGFVSLAVENLMTNSVYWVQTRLQPGETSPTISLELDSVSRTLTFRDNGPGISVQDKDRVFTAGFSLRPKGQGLGLFIAAEVATFHKAKLHLDSADDDGHYRAFVLELPKE